jgi:selenocysteine-specific elongation factor
MDRLAALTQGTPTEVLLQAALALGIAPIREITKRSGLDSVLVEPALQEALESGEIKLLEKGAAAADSDLLAAHAAVWSTETSRAEREVGNFHQANPLRIGIPREMLKSRLKMSQRGFQAAVKAWVTEGIMIENGQLIHLPGFIVRFNSQQQTRIDGLFKQFAATPYSTPSVKDCTALVGEEVYAALIDQGELIAVSPEVVFRKSDYLVMLKGVRHSIQLEGSLSAAQFRDLYKTSRKYALAFLEHLDAIGVTVRDGDVRKLGK